MGEKRSKTHVSSCSVIFCPIVTVIGFGSTNWERAEISRISGKSRTIGNRDVSFMENARKRVASSLESRYLNRNPSVKNRFFSVFFIAVFAVDCKTKLYGEDKGEQEMYKLRSQTYLALRSTPMRGRENWEVSRKKRYSEDHRG